MGRNLLPKAPASAPAVIRRLNAWLPVGCGGEALHRLLTTASRADSGYWYSARPTALHLRVTSRLCRIARREHARQPSAMTADQLLHTTIDLAEIAGGIIVTTDDLGGRAARSARQCWQSVIAAGDRDPDPVLADDTDGLIAHLEAFYPGRGQSRLPAPRPRP